MAANWVTIEDALRVWVKSATGYADSAVIWAEQTGARPSGSIITLRLGELLPIGAYDELTSNTDLLRPAGTEVELKVEGMREFAVSLQAFGASTTGNSTGRAVLAKCQAALTLPSVRTALAAAGITPFDIGAVQNISALSHTKFEGRAILEVRFYVRDSISEFTGYIETVEKTSYMGPPDSGTADAIDIP